MFRYGYLHALVVQKSDGSVLYTAGSLGKDPALISGYVSAFASMDKEFVIASDSTVKGYRSRFHNIGNILLLIGGDDKVIAYMVYAEVNPHLIDELQEVLRIIFGMFTRLVLDHLSEEELELGIIPDDLINEFEEKLFSFFLTSKFFEYARLSDLFITSEIGFRLLTFVVNKLYEKISESLGRDVFWILLESATNLARSDIEFHNIIKFNEDENKVELKVPKNIPSDFYIIQLCKVLYEMRRLVQNALGKNLLEENLIFEGVGKIVRIEASSN